MPKLYGSRSKLLSTDGASYWVLMKQWYALVGKINTSSQVLYAGPPCRRMKNQSLHSSLELVQFTQCSEIYCLVLSLLMLPNLMAQQISNNINIR